MVREVITISVEKTAQELAAAIKETEEYINLSATHARIQLDPSAQELVSQMEQSQRKIQEAQSQGQSVSDDIQQLQLLQQKAMNNETLKGFFMAQEEFSKVMEKANQIITGELFG